METETMNLDEMNIDGMMDTQGIIDDSANTEEVPKHSDEYYMALNEYYDALGVICMYMLRSEREKVFNGLCDIVDILRNYPPEALMAQVKEYRENMIIIGDIVEIIDVDTDEPVEIVATKINSDADSKMFVYGFDKFGKTHKGSMKNRLPRHIDFIREFISE